MLLAKDFKCRALDRLKGKWKNVYMLALFCALIALVFNLAAVIYLKSTGITYNPQNPESFLAYLSSKEYSNYNMISMLGSVFAAFIMISETWLYLSVSYNQNPAPSQFFGTLKRIGESFILAVNVGIRIFLWTLLFVIPGIIKAFSYSMAFKIKTENPEMSCSDAIKESMRIMNGNKWRLFCLSFSFIGWYLLAFIGLGLIETIFGDAGMFINPFISAVVLTIITVYSGVAVALFYRSIKGEDIMNEENTAGKPADNLNQADNNNW